MGDALAIALMEKRHFLPKDFAHFHPGGELGKRLLTTAQDVMRKDDLPILPPEMHLGEAIILVSKGKLGLGIAEKDNRIMGIITDGDIRRCLAKGSQFLDEPVEELMTKNPHTITQEKLAASALSIMEKHKPRPITVLPVVSADNKPVGIVHLTDLLRQGVV
jgi:arabinose-5-phosphate isomerase